MDKYYYEIRKITLEYANDGGSSKLQDVVGRFTSKEKAYAFVKARSIKEYNTLSKDNSWNFEIDPINNPSGHLNTFMEAQLSRDGGEKYIIIRLDEARLNDDDYDNNGNCIVGKK